MKAVEQAAAVAVLQEIAKNTGAIVQDHERRIRKVERWMMYGSGIAAAASLALHFFEVFKK
jgi:hypothetical protein